MRSSKAKAEKEAKAVYVFVFRKAEHSVRRAWIWGESTPRAGPAPRRCPAGLVRCSRRSNAWTVATTVVIGKAKATTPSSSTQGMEVRQRTLEKCQIFFNLFIEFRIELITCFLFKVSEAST